MYTEHLQIVDHYVRVISEHLYNVLANTFVQAYLYLLIYLILLNIFNGLQQQVIVILYYSPLQVLYIVNRSKRKRLQPAGSCKINTRNIFAKKTSLSDIHRSIQQDAYIPTDIFIRQQKKRFWPSFFDLIPRMYR